MKICALLAMSLFPLLALAQTPPELKGIWVIDPKQTEQVMKNTSPPPSAEPGFVAGFVGFLFLLILEFDEEGLTVDAYRGGKALRYRHRSTRDGKTEYARHNPPRPDEEEVLTVTALGQRSIHIRSSRQPFLELCAWQRGRAMDANEQFEAGKRAIEAWQETVRNLGPVWMPEQPSEDSPTR